MFAAVQALRLVTSGPSRSSSAGSSAAGNATPSARRSGSRHDATTEVNASSRNNSTPAHPAASATRLPSAHGSAPAPTSPLAMGDEKDPNEFVQLGATTQSYPLQNLDHIDDPEKIQPISSDPITSTGDLAHAKETGGAEPIRPDSPDDLDPSHPPSLEYSLHNRKFFIFIFWTLILVDSIAIPLVMYFCLHYLTTLTPNDVFSISTACLGGVSILEYMLRFWRLYNKNSTCRIIGDHPWYYLDWFHWNFSAAWIFIMVELIVGTSPDYPPIRLLAMPPSSLCYWFSLLMLTQTTMRYFGFRAPVRISSIPKGEPLRPAVYSIVEDICAVDGSGGTEFRERLNKRYEASHYFRQMLHRLTLVWAVNMLAIAIATTVLIFTLNDGEIAYIVGWTAPFVWAGMLTLWTFWYVKRRLRLEHTKWAESKGLP